MAKIGEPREEILKAAEEHQVDLIIMGSRGLNVISKYPCLFPCPFPFLTRPNFPPFQCSLSGPLLPLLNIRLFLGSVSDHVVKNSPCSVTIVKKPKLEPIVDPEEKILNSKEHKV